MPKSFNYINVIASWLLGIAVVASFIQVFPEYIFGWIVLEFNEAITMELGKIYSVRLNYLVCECINTSNCIH